MIRLLVGKLGAALVKQGVPVTVIAGPELTTAATATHERIVLSRGASDAFAGPIMAARNPREPLSRAASVVMRIYARSNVGTATVQDHFERAEHILESALTELDAVVRSLPLMPMQVGTGGWVTLDDAIGSQRFSGAVYEVEIGIVHGLARRKWDGSVAREVQIGPDGVTVTTIGKVAVDNIGDAPLGEPPTGASTIGGS